MSSFFDIGISSHLRSDNQLIKLDKMLTWDRFRLHLRSVHGVEGPTGYDVLKMFKLLILQNWHSLSDAELENTLRVRLDFLSFSGFSLGSDLPDETTICRFRNKLVSQGKLELLFNELNNQLELEGLKVKAADVAIVDATIISSAARPRKTVEIIDKEQNYELKHSADKDARWLKKGKNSYFGYRAFAVCDKEGFINKVKVTPANCSESKELINLIKDLPAKTRVLTDKGFASKENKEYLKNNKLKQGIMYKAYRNQPLTNRKKMFNKLVSKLRFRIEQDFGTVKRKFDYNIASYFTTIKVEAQFTMKIMCLNLLKAVNKLKIA
jgi:transposase, IS5 family